MRRIVAALFFCILAFSMLPSPSYGVNGLDLYEITQANITPQPCGPSESNSCPQQMVEQVYDQNGSRCAESFDEFQESPAQLHYWVEDPEITAQGKANERARQFIHWTINNRAIDDAPVLGQIWLTTALVALAFVAFVVGILIIGIIISKRTNFNLNLEIFPTIIRIVMMLLYIALSFQLLLLLIQLSEILMQFFIDTLGGDDLFNIYFSNSGNLGTSESNYLDFVGCRDLNIRVQESVDAKLMIYKITNISYYIMGIMLILRKILLWFLMFVAPFLALLMPFVFIRNIGWIWIGVFFQWLMYGPLFALFLGALATIWRTGIPFTFDFSRVNDPSLSGYVYPTAINILYGGPAMIAGATGEVGRQLSAINTGSYVDTFAEYVITLIMLWAVTFFPWWLLRIFRDYCCDGIYAMKNVLFAMYDQQTSKKPPSGPKPPMPKFPGMKTSLKIPTELEIDQVTRRNRERSTDTSDERSTSRDRYRSDQSERSAQTSRQRSQKQRVMVKLESMEQIKKASTDQIADTLDLRASNLTDIASMEQNSATRKALHNQMQMLSNPATATSSADRQKFMNLRTELFNRALKQDGLARSILSSTSSSAYEREKIRETIMKDVSQMRSQAQSQSASSSARSSASMRSMRQQAQRVSLSNDSLAQISRIANISTSETKQVMEALSKSNQKSLSKAVRQISKQLNISTSSIRTAIKQSAQMTTLKSSALMTKYMEKMSQNTKILESLSKRSGLQKSEVQSIVKAMANHLDKPANQVINNVSKVTNISEEKVKSTMQQMGSLFTVRNLILDFSEESGVEPEKIEEALGAAAAQAGEAKGPDSPDVGGPDSGGPEQPTEEEKEVEVETATTEKGKEAEAGSVDVDADGGPGPQPTGEEKELEVEAPAAQTEKEAEAGSVDVDADGGPTPQPAEAEQDLASQLAARMIENEAFVSVSGITMPELETQKPVVLQSVIHIAAEEAAAANEILKEIAQEEEITEDEASELVQEQLEIAAEPEKNIEKLVEVPESISIEEYEDLKTMWEEQYENGDIPVTENMQSRDEWVDADIVTITNVMNKIMSPNEQLQQEGMDELGFIIPIFMINNLKGDQMVTYLKAKIEAAKSVKKLLEKEKEIREKLRKEQEAEDEELVEIKRDKKQEKPKLKHMTLDAPERDKTIEEIGERNQ